MVLSNSNEYFESIPSPFAAAIADCPLSELAANLSGIRLQILQLLLKDAKTAKNLPQGTEQTEMLYFHEAFNTGAIPYYNDAKSIYLGENVKIEPGALIFPNCIVLNGSVLRQGAYIRELSIVGEHCVLGHCTEIKQSILFNHVEAGHFNYIGNSVIGNYVNLGAGAKLANLQFRTLQQKKDHYFPTISVHSGIIPATTERITKIGSVIGDGCEIGCNAVLAPAVFLKLGSTVMPNSMVAKGIYPKHSRI